MQAAIRRWFTPAPDSEAVRNIRKGKSPWVDAVHLLWTIWIPVAPLFDRFSWTWLWLTLVSYPIFLVLYAKSCVATQRQVPFFGLATVALALVLMPWYSSSLVYFVFGCVMFRVCRMSIYRHMLVLAALNATCLAEAWLIHYPWQAVIWLPVTSFIVALIIHAERRNEEMDSQLRLSHDEVRRLAATAERERIGRDLHDLLGHTLSLITLKLELSRKLFDRDSEASRRELEEAERVARHALAEVRAAVTGIRSTDLAAELASARLMLESSAVRLDYGVLPDSLPQDVERGLALVLREAVTNIHRHAEATMASVRFDRNGDKLEMQISDNGKGGLAAHGNGLSGMCERVRGLSGTLQIESPPHRGTRLLVTVPLDAKKANTSALPQAGASVRNDFLGHAA
ncbi:sensor histidine kinase [Dyella flagellata]